MGRIKCPKCGAINEKENWEKETMIDFQCSREEGNFVGIGDETWEDAKFTCPSCEVVSEGDQLEMVW